jgi:hypothetical protein
MFAYLLLNLGFAHLLGTLLSFANLVILDLFLKLVMFFFFF